MNELTTDAKKLREDWVESKVSSVLALNEKALNESAKYIKSNLILIQETVSDASARVFIMREVLRNSRSGLLRS